MNWDDNAPWIGAGLVVAWLMRRFLAQFLVVAALFVGLCWMWFHTTLEPMWKIVGSIALLMAIGWLIDKLGLSVQPHQVDGWRALTQSPSTSGAAGVRRVDC